MPTYEGARFVLDEDKIEDIKRREEKYLKRKIKFMLICMEPLQYLKMILWDPSKRPYEFGRWYFTDEQKDKIIEALKEHIPLPPPMYEEGVWTEGRTRANGKNRAYWSWKLGIKEIPILINEKAFKLATKYGGRKRDE
ncbi:hypothetical protein ES703_24941 [subsurface metagenome]